MARGGAARALRGVPARRARARPRRLHGDEAHHRPAPLRRDPHREHVRRHPQRRGVGGHGLARAAAQRLDRGRRGGWRRSLRAGARLRAGHRRAGDRQPAGHVPVGRAHAAPRSRSPSGGLGRRIGGGPRARRGAADPGPRRHGEHGGGDAGGARTPRLRSEDVEQADLIWMNGEFVNWEDAKVHVLTHGLHYGTGVFEGIRCYDTEIGPAVFRHRDHLDRLFKSAELYYMPIPYPLEELRAATHELIGRNGLRSCYIRPLVFRGYGQMGLFPLDAPVDVTIAVWEWGAYLGEEGKRDGIRAKVSSWRRISDASLIPQAKACGQYLNSVLAKIESHKAGYEEAILLDDDGNVCEGSGENIFVGRDGSISTPPLTASILDGISRRSIIQ